MIFKIAFNIICILMFVGNLFYGMRIFSIGLSMREKYKHLIGKGWNGRINSRQMQRLKGLIQEKDSRQAIDKFLELKRRCIIIMLSGISLLLLIGLLNRILPDE
jgi:hypothetical protein